MGKLNILKPAIVATSVAFAAGVGTTSIQNALTNDKQDTSIVQLETTLTETQKRSKIDLGALRKYVETEDDKLREDIISSNEKLATEFGFRLDKTIEEFNGKLNQLRDDLIAVIGDSAQYVNLRITDSVNRIRNKCITLDGKLKVQSSRLDKVDSTFFANKVKLDSEMKQLWLAIAPVGSILPFTGSIAPQNWVICDGRRINDPKSTYHNQKSPDLQGHFVRGLEQGEIAGREYGKDTIGPHRHEVPEHNHQIAMQRIRFNTDHDCNNPGFCNCKDGNAVQCTPITGSNQCPIALSGVTLSDLSHSHNGTMEIPQHETNGKSSTSLAAGGHNNVPRYVAYNYIMRIK